ncbi:ADP-ribosylglycohydrolase family protein [Arenicella sp. 4NH20-0111]|uniref:ADP-ribosylglycohydrolase family protein n=1 Tax=Arenicella sp. 4NH20-0111 TaxID=3127648 RepID=UPI0033408D26
MEDKFRGCFLGLAFGDATCAPHEGGFAERLLWRMIGTTKASEMRFTDDTQMSLDIARSFTKEGGIKQDELAREFSSSYRWSRGYGPGAGKILKRIESGMPWQKANVSIYKDGSFGNGAAMRAPILAMCYPPTSSEFEKSVVQSSEITHSNPLAIEGALLIAYTTAYALSDMSNDVLGDRLIEIAELDAFVEKLEHCKHHLRRNSELSVREVRTIFGNKITAEQSCITAIYLAMAFREWSFTSLLSFVKKLGGDTDTIAAMSCAIWGAFNGAEKLELEMLPRIEEQNEIQSVATQLYKIYQANNKIEIEK